MEDKNQWMVRTDKGKITGPFSTREILLKIKKNEIEGNESISKFPSGSWRPISHNPEFYDFLLTHLSRVQDFDDDETNWESIPDIETLLPSKEEIKESTSKSLKTIKITPEETPELPDKTIVVEEKDKKAQKNNFQDTKKNKKKIIDKSEEYDFSRDVQKAEQKQDEKIEQNSKSQVRKKVKKRSTKNTSNKNNKVNPLSKILLICVLGAGIYYVLQNKDLKKDTIVEIKAIKSDLNLNPEQVKKLADEGVKYFVKDTFDGYLRAQDNFIQVLSADKSYGDIFSLLCITQYNLWPYSKNNDKNLKTLLSTIQSVKSFDSKSLNYYNCNNVYLILSGEQKNALKSLDTIIDQNMNSEVPPTLSYYLKSKVLIKENKKEAALEYAQRLTENWPDWMASYFMKGQIQFDLQNKDEAILNFKTLIKSNSKNKKALLYIGSMRNVFFKQYQKSIDEIKYALKIPERVQNDVLAKSYYYLADSYVQIGENEKAKKSIQLAYKANPLDKTIENLYVNFYGDESVVKLSDQSYLEQGDQLFASGDYNSAQAYYKEAIKVNNKNTKAAVKAALALERLNLGEDAVEILKNSLQSNPKSVNVAVSLSKLYNKQFLYKESFDVLNVTHKKVRGHYKIYLQFAELELHQQHYMGAIKYADKSLKIYGNNIGALITKGQAYLEMEENKKGYAELAKALDIDSANVTANFYFLKAYYRIHGADASIRKINKLISTKESEIEYHQLLGEVLYEDEQFTRAEDKFKQVIQIDDKYQKGYLWLANTYKKLNQINDAKTYYIKAASVDLQNFEPLLQLGLLYLETKKYKKAIKQFKGIIELNDKYPRAKFYYAKSLFYLKNYKKALEILNQEKISNPNNVDSYLLSGEIHEILGQYQLCKREFQQALQYREFGAAFYLTVSRCHRKSGSLDVALNMLEKSRELSPNLPDIYRELGAVYEVKGNNEKAVWSYERYLFLSPGASDSKQIRSKIRILSN